MSTTGQGRVFVAGIFCVSVSVSVSVSVFVSVCVWYSFPPDHHGQVEMFCTTVAPAPKGHLGGASP